MKKIKTILITGASSGIGKSTAVFLAQKGYKVFAGVRRKTDKTMLENINPNIVGTYIDVTNKSSIDKAFWFICKNCDKLDVIINNAGIVVAGPLECIEIEKLKEQFDVNTFGAVSVVQKFMPLLSNSKIINISSMASTGIFPFISPYCASKRALDILFNSFSLENKSNIKVISIKPASIKTPIWTKSVLKTRQMADNYTDSSKEKYEKELKYLENNALENNNNGLDVEKVVNCIYKIIESDNPKSSYNVGMSAVIADFVSKLPIALVNKLIKHKLNNIR